MKVTDGHVMCQAITWWPHLSCSWMEILRKVGWLVLASQEVQSTGEQNTWEKRSVSNNTVANRDNSTNISVVSTNISNYLSLSTNFTSTAKTIVTIHQVTLYCKDQFSLVTSCFLILAYWLFISTCKAHINALFYMAFFKGGVQCCCLHS